MNEDKISYIKYETTRNNNIKYVKKNYILLYEKTDIK